MKKSAFILISILASLLSFNLLANEIASNVVKIKDAYIRAMPATMKTTASFMTLNNTGKDDHDLIAAISSAAKRVQIHKTIDAKGVKKMRRVWEIALPAGKETHLRPGGYHVMLMGLKRPLMIGQRLPISLIFKDGSHLKVYIKVKKDLNKKKAKDAKK